MQACLYVVQVTSTVMHLGEMKFKQKSSKDDQATPDGTDPGKKVATLMGRQKYHF